MNVRRILLSLAFVVAVGAAFAGATGAFYSDSEKSIGNVLAAGDIDLKIDNESYYNGVLSTSTTWLVPTDLTNELFFNFTDLKPGDIGEDTISIHTGSNPAWVCMDLNPYAKDDNSITEPEASDGDVTDGPGNGELQNFLNFVWWKDDGDNVLETDELASATTSKTFAGNGTTTIALADTSGGALFGSQPLTGSSTNYIAKAWCFGDLALAPLAQDGLGATSSRTPANSTGGVTCDGAPVNNVSQTDSVKGDVVFRAVQSRHNEQFVCSVPAVVAPTTGTLNIVKIVVGGQATTSDFTPVLDGVSTSSFPFSATLVAGAHVVGESGTPVGYTPSFSGDCNATTTVTVPAGGSATCTITNTFSSPN